MFTNYYKLVNVSPEASAEEIDAAIEKCTLSPSLKEEMKMVLLNKSLKELYDAEHRLYVASESKQNYEITNPDLDREIKKVKAYISNKARESVAYEAEEEEAKSRSNTWLWIIGFIVLSTFGKCVSSYYKGKAREENRQKYMRGEYDYRKYSTDVPTLDLHKFITPNLK